MNTFTILIFGVFTITYIVYVEASKHGVGAVYKMSNGAVKKSNYC